MTLKTEGDTGSPMSRFEFICRWLSEAMHVENAPGYDVYWLLASSLVFSSAKLDFLLGPETFATGDNAAQSRLLQQRTYDLPHANHDVARGPWPMSAALTFTDIIALRMVHYMNCIRPKLVVDDDFPKPHGFFLHFSGRKGGRGIPLTEEMVWASLRNGLAVMEQFYPISARRYLPLLTKVDDFSTFLRWRFEPHGRAPDDPLSDDNAAMILCARPNAARQNKALIKDLEHDLRMREARVTHRETLIAAYSRKVDEAGASSPRSLRQVLADRRKQDND